MVLRKAQYGAFASPSAGDDISTDAHTTAAIALGEVDGDSDLDLVAGNYSSLQSDRLCLNNGDGTFVEGSDIPGKNLFTYMLAG